MKEIIINENNLTEEDITETKKKTKILLVTTDHKILLAYSHDNYEFPGGTNEEEETLIDTLNREIEEEVGISLN